MKKKLVDYRIMDIHTGVVAPCIILLLFCLLISHASAAPITIEYYYLEGCSDCAHLKSVIQGIEHDLGDSVDLSRINVDTHEGVDRLKQYGFHEVPAVVVNGTIQIPKEEFTEENIRAAIERALSETDMGGTPSDGDWDVPLAYSFGLFSGFSPCLMAILGFILTYVTGSGKGLRNSIHTSSVKEYFHWKPLSSHSKIGQ